MASEKLLNIPPPPTSNHPHTPLPNARGSIIYTETDEAPSLAAYSLLPVLAKFSSLAGVDVVPCDISLSGRVLAAFPERLDEGRRVPDNLAYLGELADTPDANIIKLPNVSASIPQLNDCISELRSKGYDVPPYPPDPTTDEERSVRDRYAGVLGSAVNPVLRRGNSDRHASDAVKADAKRRPNKLVKGWPRESRTHVAHMTGGDFYESERSVVVGDEPADVVIELAARPDDGEEGEEEGKEVVQVLKESVPLLPGEVIDGSFMDVRELRRYYEDEMDDARDAGVLFSLHLKATMMKVSDPILFGHCVRAYFREAFEGHNAVLEGIGVRPDEGLGSVFETIREKLPADTAEIVLRDFEKCRDVRPRLAMVDSDDGITNLHVPSDVIIDNSMPVVVRDSGRMYDEDGKLRDVKCCIPDRSYATTYREVIDYVKAHGQFDPSTMGNVSNVGLMALKAEEYGSHDKTFEIPRDGTVRVRDRDTGEVYLRHDVRSGDVWRMCQTKDAAIEDWVGLAVDRARETGAKAVFWLDPGRAHDASVLDKVRTYLDRLDDASDVDVDIMKPERACRLSMERATRGLDTISVTGNVLRDYLTDLFPILELGTSAKVLSIVPLLSGGGLYETGAGGSAPRHVRQFAKSAHLRWNSLGEYQAVAEAYTRLGRKAGNVEAATLGRCLYEAVGVVLERDETPGRDVYEFDNRDANFSLALHWAEALAREDPGTFGTVYEKLDAAKGRIAAEIAESQGREVDLGGYYLFDYDRARRAMNPSGTLNDILESIRRPSDEKGTERPESKVLNDVIPGAAATTTPQSLAQ